MAWLKCNTYQGAKVDPVTFSYTGGIQTYTVPASGTYKLEVWGAQGGDVAGNGSNWAAATGGKGGYSVGYVDLNAGTVLNVVVGGKSTGSNPSSSVLGYNGGGANYPDSRVCAGGGGATHIAKSDGNYTTLASYGKATTADDYVLIVAGGGGGAANGASTNSYSGGTGGGSSGGAGASSGGGGATQSAAGSSFVAENNYAGGFGYGGYQINGYDGCKLIAGGGGGWYGGGTAKERGGGGGSGWIGGVTNGTTTANQRSGNGQAKISKV